MKSLGQESYFRSLKEMRPLVIGRNYGTYSHFSDVDQLLWDRTTYLATEDLPMDSSERYNTRTLFFEIPFISTVIMTLVPIIPGSLWALLTWTRLGEWLDNIKPVKSHPLVDAYSVSVIVLIILGTCWYIESKFRPQSRPTVDNKPEMSFEQTLFYWAAAALDAVTSFGINHSNEQLSSAIAYMKRLRRGLKRLDLQERDLKSPLVQIPAESFRKLNILLQASSKVLGSLEGESFKFEQVRAVLDPLTLILYSCLPDLPKLLDSHELGQLVGEAQEAWPRLERAAADLEPAPKPIPPSQPEPQQVAEPSYSSLWFTSLFRLLANAAVGFVLSALFVTPVYLWISSNIQPQNADTLRIATLPVFFTLAMAIATALFSRDKAREKSSKP